MGARSRARHRSARNISSGSRNRYRHRHSLRPAGWAFMARSPASQDRPALVAAILIAPPGGVDSPDAMVTVPFVHGL